MEKVSSVFVDFDAGFGFGFGIGVAADVAPTFDDEDALPELRGGLFGDGEAEETGADDNQIIGIHGA